MRDQIERSLLNAQGKMAQRQFASMVGVGDEQKDKLTGELVESLGDVRQAIEEKIGSTNQHQTEAYNLACRKAQLHGGKPEDYISDATYDVVNKIYWGIK